MSRPRPVSRLDAATVQTAGALLDVHALPALSQRKLNALGLPVATSTATSATASSTRPTPTGRSTPADDILGHKIVDVDGA